MSAMNVCKTCWQHMRDVSSKQVGCAFHLHTAFAAGPLIWVVTYNIEDDIIQHPSCWDVLQHTELWLVTSASNMSEHMSKYCSQSLAGRLFGLQPQKCLQVLRHESATSAVGNPNKKPGYRPRAQATPGPRAQAPPFLRAQATPFPRTQAPPFPRTQAPLGPRAQATGPRAQAPSFPRAQATLGPRAQATPGPRAQATPVGSVLDPTTGLPLWFSPGTGNSAPGSASASKRSCGLQKRSLKTELGDQSCVSVLMPCLSTEVHLIEQCPMPICRTQALLIQCYLRPFMLWSYLLSHTKGLYWFPALQPLTMCA